MTMYSGDEFYGDDITSGLGRDFNDQLDQLIEDTIEERHELYCDLCEVEGHTFRTCPRRDDI